MLAEILNVVQVFTPAHAVTVCYCCYCCSAASKQKTAKNPGKTRKYLGFPGYFRVLPALDAGDRRGSLPGLPYCCSAGLTLATVVGEPHCCSVVTVNTSNTVQLPTLNSSTWNLSPLLHLRARMPRRRLCLGFYVCDLDFGICPVLCLFIYSFGQVRDSSVRGTQHDPGDLTLLARLSLLKLF